MRLDSLAGLHWQRLNFDTLTWHGIVYRYENACTFVDVFFGAVPLLWMTRKTLAWNLSMIAVLACGLFAFNVIRLSISDVIFATGIPWDIAHNVISGFAYFAVWVFIWRRHSWDITSV
jgi:hypothetical protein